jgi:tetratricopeptide (TPR) repeat protein
MLTALGGSIQACQALVTYNGKSFDAPLLNTRYTLHGFESPIPSLAHLDLLPLARRLWKDSLPSRSLGNIEFSILGAARTQDEVPGWMIPQIYFDYLRSGDPHPLSGVLYHNAMDILSLAGLFSHTVSLLANPIELDVPDGVDLVSIARLMEDLGYPDIAITLYKRGLEKGLAEPFFWDSLNRLALLHRKRLEWEAAIELWQKAAQHKQIEAHVELAKYFEHIARSPRDALTWTDMAIEIVSQPGYPRYLQRHLLPGLEHRRGRLLGKISKNGTDQVEENDAQN